MPDPNPNPNEGDQKIDLSNYVPKDELSKLETKTNAELGNLKKSLQEAQQQLVSPEYLDYLEAKKGKQKAPVETEAKLDPTLKQALDAYEEKFKLIGRDIQNLAAYLELQEVEKKYPDFSEHREEIDTLLSTKGTNLNFEQAYLIVKAGKEPDEEDGEKGTKLAPKPRKGTEKPTTFAPSSNTGEKKDFKSDTEATAATLQEIRERHGITGDTI